MYVIAVTPLIRGTKLESLSYFSSVHYEVGSFIEVPIRKKNQRAIVTSAQPAKMNKTSLKAASFSLRKLPKQEKVSMISRALCDTVSFLTKTYPTTAGAIMYQLLPPDVRNGSCLYPEHQTIKMDEDSTPHVLTARSDERLVSYQSIVRSNFAKKQSTLLVVPTTAHVSIIQKQLSGGIKDRIVVIASTQTKRQRDKAFEDFKDLKQAKLIITTPAYAYLPRPDSSTIIIEQAGSQQYVTRTKPYLDHREGLKAFAVATKQKLILADVVLATEDEHKRREDVYQTFDEEVKRVAFPAPLTIINQKDASRPKVPFQLFSPELVQAVSRAVEGRGHVFLYAARRGLSPVVHCQDCSHIFRCPDSGTPYSLLRTVSKNGEEERWFASSTSGRRVRAADSCTQCGSWRLRERGIGIQQVADEWEEQFPNLKATTIDQTTAKTPKEVEKKCKEFFTQPSGVLIGTQIVLPHLSHGVAVSSVISLDAARSVPTWRADESLFRLLLKLRECTSQEVIIQTRTETDNLLSYATRGALERFYDDEIDLRKMVQYPPICTFILLTWTGPEETCQDTEKTIVQTLPGANIQCYNSPNTTKLKTTRHGLIRTNPEDSGRHQTLLDRLRSLPPYIKIEVNPERIV